MHTPAFGILMMLASVGFVGVAALWVFVTYVRGRPVARAAAQGLIGLATWGLVYAAALMTTSLSRAPRILALNESKPFCGFYLDCHLHAAVTRAEPRASVVDDSGRVVEARGRFEVVTVQLFSDAARARLTVMNPVVELRDAVGNRYERSRVAEEALARAGEPVAPIATELGPEDRVVTTMVFDVPDDRRELMVDVTIGHPAERLIERFLIGDADSAFYRRGGWRIAR